MRDILIYLIALKQYIKQYHWLAKGYENHILADKLEDGLETEIDELAELILATDENTNIMASELLQAASEKILPSAQSGEMKQILQSIATMSGQILGMCKNTKPANELAELAFADYLGRLSNSLLRKLYLIQIQYGKE